MNRVILKKIINKYNSNCKKYEFNNNSIIFTDNLGNKFIAKKNINDIKNVYEYLSSRSFEYKPEIIISDNEGYICKYEKEIEVPIEQRIDDIIKIISLLHNKTSFYIDSSKDEYKELYENIIEKINNNFNYYEDLINIIENKIYMSPSEYLLIRNCSTIFSCLNYCKEEISKWYEEVKETTKKRVVLLHNNLDISHIVENENKSLVSWDKSKFDIPIYDFINLYKKYYEKYDFFHLYTEYNKKFKLLHQEKLLLNVLLFLPERIEWESNEIKNTLKVAELCNYLHHTNRSFMEYEKINTNEKNNDINK